MTFKRFESKDIVYNTIVTKPEVNFLVHSGNVYYQYHRTISGSHTDKVKHIPQGHLNLLEQNIDRPSGSLITPFIQKTSTRYAWKSISTTQFDDNFQFLYGDTLYGPPVHSASIGRIFIPSGIEFDEEETEAHANKKYIRSLKTVLESQDHIGSNVKYGNLGTSEVNMLCIPGIFYGSKIEKGSLELNYYTTGALTATATDKFSDGRLIQVSGAAATNGTQVGSIIYNHGIILLTSSANLHASYTDRFNGASQPAVAPKWTNFGTGIKQTGVHHSHSAVSDSSYSIKFKGINKIPNITMYAYAKKGELNFSINPTFTTSTSLSDIDVEPHVFTEESQVIKKINKSIYTDHEEDFENVTYITKIGIYDKYKNLIAVASLANPIKKTEKRDFMFKLGIDF